MDPGTGNQNSQTHCGHPRRRANRQTIHALQSERMSLGDAAKLVSVCFSVIEL